MARIIGGYEIALGVVSGVVQNVSNKSVFVNGVDKATGKTGLYIVRFDRALGEPRDDGEFRIRLYEGKSEVAVLRPRAFKPRDQLLRDGVLQLLQEAAEYTRQEKGWD